jgi:putative transposase
VPGRPNAWWSMDFVGDTLGDGRIFRALNIEDDFSREAVAIEVGRSIPGARVARVLEGLPEPPDCRRRS